MECENVWFGKTCFIAAAFALGIGLSSTATAADVAMPTKAPVVAPARIGNSWTFSLSPYSWATSLSGSTTVKGRTTDIDAAFLIF